MALWALVAVLLPHLYWLPLVQRWFYPLHFEEDLMREARVQGLDPCLVAAVVYHESRFSATARSRVGAVGLMQLMPGTAVWVADREGVEGPLELERPDLNLRLGASYLRTLLDRYEGDLVPALAAYNGGPSNVERWKGEDGRLAPDEIGYAETSCFVRGVLASRARYRELYPDLAAGP
ncbi:MAG: lytic transglycosylase domain-containing protein [Candidatus Eremiobacterota bacterium]